jgi:hypothetical protein
MTVKEFMNAVQEMMELTPAIANCEMGMVGYNENGERVYNIPVIDYTYNVDEKIVRLWDN